MTNEKRDEPYVCMLILLVHTVEMYMKGDAAARWPWPVEVSGEGSRAFASCCITQLSLGQNQDPLSA